MTNDDFFNTSFESLAADYRVKIDKIRAEEQAEWRAREREEILNMIGGYIEACKQIPSNKKEDNMVIVQLNCIKDLIRARGDK